MNLQRFLSELVAIYETDPTGQWSGHRAAAIVNEVSEAMAKAGHSELVRAPIPDCDVIDAKRYLAACIAASKEQSQKLHAFTPPQVAKLLGVSPESVIALIRSGELDGSNIGNGMQRPRYRVTQAAIDSYLEGKQSEPILKSRRESMKSDVIDFFP